MIKNTNRSMYSCKSSASFKLRTEIFWDINDVIIPFVNEFDEFDEWVDGHHRLVYSASNDCLGVLFCSAKCSLPSGKTINLRPAICDKARRKQQGRPCPNRSCSGRLEIQSCKGHSGYPVTHFWRRVNNVIYFQSKGTHDHPKPEAKGSTEIRRLLASSQRARKVPSSGKETSSLEYNRKIDTKYWNKEFYEKSSMKEPPKYQDLSKKDIRKVVPMASISEMSPNLCYNAVNLVDNSNVNHISVTPNIKHKEFTLVDNHQRSSNVSSSLSFYYSPTPHQKLLTEKVKPADCSSTGDLQFYTPGYRDTNNFNTNYNDTSNEKFASGYNCDDYYYHCCVPCSSSSISHTHTHPNNQRHEFARSVAYFAAQTTEILNTVFEPVSLEQIPLPQVHRDFNLVFDDNYQNVTTDKHLEDQLQYHCTNDGMPNSEFFYCNSGNDNDTWNICI
ncbi:transcription factor glial cells missing isoform X2 [Eurosta solidaginis]|uniref:transcription factor glial cells missing isoform X2 n=1 Tax=Eurosta solidaginis TaxID=178769 RepID=UPI003530CA0E